MPNVSPWALSTTQDGADTFAYYTATTFFNVDAASSIDRPTMQAIIGWNGKFLDSLDDSKQWTDRKQLWAKFISSASEAQ